MINTIIFDIGNVLAYFHWEEIYRKYFSDDEFEQVANVTVRDLNSWNLIDQGLNSFDDYIDYVGETLPNLKEKIRKVILEIFETIMPFDYAESWVKEMKERGYKVYILSNYGDLPFNLSKARYTFLNHVDGEIISYREKVIKPDKEIFEILFNRFEINPSQAVFIDDNANNIEGAKKVGLNTIHFTDFQKAQEELEVLLKWINIDWCRIQS